ncbi:MAG: AAA family ATPase [Betaproteobacteria bacterium]
MKIDIVCSSARTLEAIRRLAASEGCEIGQAVVRNAGEPLPPYLRLATGDALLLEGSCADTADLATIEKVTAERRGLAVLMLSPVNGSEDLMAAMRAGVREVLQTPPKPAELAAALARIARRRLERAPKGRVVSFIPCKGGSGATFLAANVAHMLATIAERRTALIDLDLEYGDASFFVAAEPAKSNVVEVAQQGERLDGQLLVSSMLTVAPRFTILPAPSEPEAALAITPQQLERLIEVARETFEFVVLDLQRALDPLTVTALDKSDAIYLVMENMIPYVRNAKRMVGVLRGLGYADSKMRLVLNRYERRSVVTIAEIERTVGLKVSHLVPNSWEDVAQSTNLGVPLAQLNSRNAVVHALRNVLDELTQPGPKATLRVAPALAVHS